MSAFDGLRRHRALVWFVALGVSAGGAFVARTLPSAIYPEVEFPRIVVVARSGDAPPDVTQLVLTRPLEQALATVQGVERIQSKTIRGAAELSLHFAPGTDMWRALQLTESRVAEGRAALPGGVDITVERLSTTSFPILTFNLTGAVDPRRLNEWGELVLKPALSRVRGVGRVEVLGGDVREVEVIVDLEKAAAMRLGPTLIAVRVKEQSALTAVGRLEQAHAQMTVLASSEPLSLADLERLPIAVGVSGTPVPLSAVAQVVEGAEDRLLRVSGPGGETVLISVARLPGASTPEVVAGALAAANDVTPLLPPGVALTPVYDQAELVQESIASVRDAILIGVALCILVIAVFLRDVRSGLAAAIAVPITLGATFLPMALLGQSLNLMSLGGLAVAIGLVIDDAIVVVEGIGRAREQGLSPTDAAARATRQLLAALVGTTLTTVVVFVPLAWLEGVVGRFFSALAVTLSAAVLLSLLVSVTVVPLAASQWVGALKTARHGLSDRYAPWLAGFLRMRWAGPVVGVALLALGVVAAQRVPSGFLPAMDEGAFVLDYFLPAGTSLTDADTVARKIEAVLAKAPDVATWSRRTGAELGPAAATQVDRGDIMVRLKPRSVRKASAEEVIAGLREEIGRDIPEARTEFVQVLQDVLNDLAGAPHPVEVKLFGDDYRVLRSQATAVVERIHDVEGLVDLYPGFEAPAPELRVRIDPDAAARAGTQATAVSEALDGALHGTVAATLRRGDRPIGIRVRAADTVRFDAQKLADLPLVVNDQVLRVSQLATVQTQASDTELSRESLRPVVVVSGDREGVDLGTLTRNLEGRLEGLKLPEGYHLVMGGQSEETRATQKALLTVMLFGMAAVLAVLLAQFRRARLALLVLLSAPLSVVGALVTLWALGVALNASSLMGCVLLVGLVVKNGILLLEQFEQQLEAHPDVAEALVAAGRIRVRPIVMTTLATIAGLAPLALGLGAGAEIQRPLAVAVIGGLVGSTGVSLFLLPSLVRLAMGARATSVE